MTNCITAFGMVSSVGHDAVTACASIRAGISRPRELNYQALDEDMMPISTIGHPVDGITDGFYFIGRLLRLAEKAVQDLIRSINLADDVLKQFLRNSGLIVVFPDSSDRYLVTVPIDDEYIFSNFVGKLLTLCELNIDPANVKIVRQGHAGTIAAIQMADQMFQSQKVHQCLILAVDSYVEETSLSWLGGQDRLKSNDNPAGLIPGEAAVCFVISSGHPPASSDFSEGLTILSSALEKDENFKEYFSENSGRVLADTIAKVLRAAQTGFPLSAEIYIDLNGENWRSREFSNALTILRKDLLSDNIHIVTPCSEIGDIGAASGAAAICLASHAFKRKYSTSNIAVILSQSENGSVGVLCVSGIG